MSRKDDPQLTVIVDRFDEAWASGTAPEIRDFLDEADDSAVRAVLIELVMVDLERRWRGNTTEAATLPPDAGQFPAKPTIEDYVARYPELGPLESLSGELIAEEYRVRSQWGDRPAHDEYLRRFPEQSTELRSELAKFDRQAATVTSAPPGNAPTSSEDITIPPEAGGTVANLSTGVRVRYFGEYELLEEIARGGMGVVFKARQVKLNRIVALKMILSGELAGDEEVQRFKTEAEAAANLDHPGIVPIYEIGEHDGKHYFSMGFVEGQSLADRVKDGPLPPRDAAEIVWKVAEAVAYAHEKGVIHRDLKPANVLLDANGEPKVTDFGLAKQLESDSDLTRTGAVMGTPSYMPPEQASGRIDEVGPRSDVYSLGAILYCLLTGRPPFQSANPMDILRQVLEREPITPRQLDRNIPRDVETICLKAIAKEAVRRYSSASEFATDLRRWLSGDAILARRVGRFEKAWLWCRRRPAIAGSLAAVFVTVCISCAVLYESKRRNLRVRSESVVATMATARGKAVPQVIERLSDYPRERIVPELIAQFEAAYEDTKLPLAFALANYGDVRVEFLLSQVKTALPEEAANLIAALAHSRTPAVSALRTAAEAADKDEDWRNKARFAVLALHLNEAELAMNMCRPGPDPVQRAWFIEECSDWHGDLAHLAEVLTMHDDAALQSGVVLAVGSIPPMRVAAADKRTWALLVSNLYTTASDASTRSSVDWIARNWKVDLPDSKAAQDPDSDRGWLANSVGMTLMRIPPGSFVRSEQDAPTERLRLVQNVVLTRPFRLSSKEVSIAQFRQFLNDEDYDASWKPERDVQNDESEARIRNEVSPSDDHPVTVVNWFDAVKYCNWLSDKEGLEPVYQHVPNDHEVYQPEALDPVKLPKWVINGDANGYRLPTEAEWEYACRAGSKTLYSFGSQERLLPRYAVFVNHGLDVWAGETTQPCGSRLPNCWGLFDVHGNASEWCQDWSNFYFFRSTVLAEVTDPQGPPSGGYINGVGGDWPTRVQRGGAFSSPGAAIASGSRSNNPPDARHMGVGFRVARTCP